MTPPDFDGHDHELFIARIVADAAREHLGRELGPPTLNDGGRAEGLFGVRDQLGSGADA